MPDECLPTKILYGEIKVGKHFHGGQKEHYKDTLKVSLKDINIPTESWLQIAQDQAKWWGLIFIIKKGCWWIRSKKNLSKNVFSRKPELGYHQQSFLPQTCHILSATSNLKLSLVSSAILEHTISNTSHIWSFSVMTCTDELSQLL